MSDPSSDPGLVLRHATVEDLDRIQPLWQALYQHQFEHGMLLRLPEGAYDAWIKSIQPFLGRFASVVLAELNGKIVGFVAGRIRTLPPYFGSEDQQITRVELQVVAGNPDGIRFYRQLGWHEELLQMVWTPGTPESS